MKGSKNKVLAVLMSAVLAFSMTSATALTAFADGLSVAGASLLAAGSGGSSVYEYEYAFGVFGDGYTLMSKGVVYRGQYFGTVADIVKADGTTTIHTNSYSTRSGYPSTETWSDYMTVELDICKGVGGNPQSDVVAGVVGLKSKSSGKYGVKRLDGSDVLPLSYDYVYGDGAGSLVALTCEGSRARLDFFTVGGAQVGSVSAPVTGSGNSYTYMTVERWGGYVKIHGQCRIGEFDAIAKADNGTYAAPVGIGEIYDGAIDGGVLVSESDGRVHYISPAGADVPLGSTAEAYQPRIRGQFIRFNFDECYTVLGDKVEPPESGYRFSDCAIGPYAVFEKYDSDLGCSHYAFVDASGATVRTVDAERVAVIDESHYSVLVEEGDRYQASIFAADGSIKASLGSLSSSWLSIYPNYNSQQTYAAWSGDAIGYVWYDNGAKRYFDSEFNELTVAPPWTTRTHEFAGEPIRVLYSIATAPGSTSKYTASVVDASGYPVKVGGYTLGVASGTVDGAWNSVRHGSDDIWWATDSAGRWGAIDSSGNVKAPFRYDSYYDIAGEAGGGNYAMVRKDGTWRFFDFKNGDETAGAPELAYAEWPSARDAFYSGANQWSGATGVGYTLSGDTMARNVGTYTIKATLESGYKWPDGSTAPLTLTWHIYRMPPAAQVKISGLSGLVYSGKAPKPVLKLNGKTLQKDYDYTLSYQNASGKKIAASKVASAATYYAIFTFQGNYTGGLTKKFTISKAANPMSVTGKTSTVKRGKKAATVKASAAYKFAKKAVGKVTYERVAKGSSSYLPKVDKKTGAITVKASAPKNKTYKVNVKVTAAGSSNYKAKSKTVSVKVTVK